MRSGLLDSELPGRRPMGFWVLERNYDVDTAL